MRGDDVVPSPARSGRLRPARAASHHPGYLGARRANRRRTGPRRSGSNRERMMTKDLARRAVCSAALAIAALVAATGAADAAANCIKGDRKPPYTIGWANIYSVPTWMKQTEGTIDGEVEELKKQGPGRQAGHHRRAGQRQHPDPADPVDDRRRCRRDHPDRRLGHRARPRRRRRLRQGHRRHQFRQPRRHRQGDRQDQHRLRRMGRRRPPSGWSSRSAARARSSS